jgi:hypothetical protein
VLHGAPKRWSFDVSGIGTGRKLTVRGITNSVSLSVTYLGQWQHLSESKLASCRISSCYRARYPR